MRLVLLIKLLMQLFFHLCHNICAPDVNGAADSSFIGAPGDAYWKSCWFVNAIIVVIHFSVGSDADVDAGIASDAAFGADDSDVDTFDVADIFGDAANFTRRFDTVIIVDTTFICPMLTIMMFLLL